MGGGLFGRIAIEKGLVTETKLAAALRFQEELRALGIEKRLGELLVDDGALTREQADQVFRLQQINDQSRYGRRFAKIAVKNGLATQDQVDSAFETARDGGFQVGIGAVLVERGILAPVAVRAIRAAIERADRASMPGTETPIVGTPTGTTARLGVALEVEPVDEPSDLDVEKKIQDVLFAAVALRNGLVLVPELERALREQARAHPDAPLLETVLKDRGILSDRELEQVAEALRAARSEKLAIPGFAITGVLGHGATSIVLKARQELIDRDVAIKLFRTEHVAATDVNAVIEEAKKIAKVRHPNVVGLYDVGRVHRRIYYVMELVDGKTLADLIRELGFLSQGAALTVVRAVACGLDAIHAAGLIHRDVKPLNILIAHDATVKIADLGLAHEVGVEEKSSQAVFGSPHTISPEQVQGEPIDIRADLYGLGATLYFALTGHPPFEGQDPVAVMTRHVTDPVPDPRAIRPEIGEDVAHLVQLLLQKKREERPETPAQVIAEIDAIRRPPAG
jgi:serine/threonine-protein kinase